MHLYDEPAARTKPPARTRRRRRRRLKKHYQILLAVLALLLAAGGLKLGLGALFPAEAGAQDTAPGTEQTGEERESLPVPEDREEAEPAYRLKTTARTAEPDGAIQSEYVLLAELESGEILVERSSTVRINPASMTKILTLLVAAEAIPDTSGTITMTREMADYCFSNECSVVGYEVGEEIPVLELFYGCILCSGADACLGLAQLAAGSHEAFVERMNEKLEELGLAETAHFTNCVGLYDEDHYCTVQDMALMLKAALENDFCREVLCTKVYQSVPTEEHPQGQVLSNWFLRRIEDRDMDGVTVACGKTGYVPESGSCAASFALDRDGAGFLCVTGKGANSKKVVREHAELYRVHCGTPEEPEAEA